MVTQTEGDLGAPGFPERQKNNKITLLREANGGILLSMY